jgi:hypothetical protein
MASTPDWLLIYYKMVAQRTSLRIATPAESSEPIKRGQRGLGAVISLMAAES